DSQNVIADVLQPIGERSACVEREHGHHNSLCSLLALLRESLHLAGHVRGEDPFTTVLAYYGWYLLNHHKLSPITQVQGHMTFDHVVVTHETLHGLILPWRVLKLIHSWGSGS